MNRLRELLKELDTELKAADNKYWASFHVVGCVLKNVPQDGLIGKFLRELAFMLETAPRNDGQDTDWILRRLHLIEGYDNLTNKLKEAAKALEAASGKVDMIVEAAKEE